MKITLTIKLGIAAGIINCIAWYAFARSLGFYSINIEQYRYYVTLFLLFAGIFASVYFERKSKAGFIDFKDALKCGVVYSLVLALVLAIFNYFYYKFIATDAIEYFLSDAKRLMIAGKVNEGDMKKNLEVIASYFGSFRMFMSTLIMGLLISLLAAATLRRKRAILPFSEN